MFIRTRRLRSSTSGKILHYSTRRWEGTGGIDKHDRVHSNLPAESEVGIALQCEEVKPSVVKEQKISSEVRVNKVMSQDEVDRRREKLKAWISEDHSFEQVKLKALLSEFHEAFSLDDDERGETDLVQLTIDTGDAPLRRQSARRIPIAAQQELAQLLESMQKSHVIQPSESPWASPVVLVRKKDGSLRL